MKVPVFYSVDYRYPFHLDFVEQLFENNVVSSYETRIKWFCSGKEYGE